MTTRRTCTKEFKLDAVRLAIANGNVSGTEQGRGAHPEWFAQRDTPGDVMNACPMCLWW